MRFKIGDDTRVKFYQLPKMLFKGKYKELSNNARVIYSFIIDRLSLSMKNKLVNEKGELYVSLKRKAIMYLMGINKDTVAKNIQSLCEVGLIDDEKIGKGESNRIYPHQLEVQPYRQIDYNIDTSDVDEEIEDNFFDEEYVCDIELLKRNIEYVETIEFFEYRVKADSLDKLETNKVFLYMYKTITNALFEVFLKSNKKTTYNIRQVERKIDDVRSQLSMLKAEHVQNITNRFIETDKLVKNKNGYIISSLYFEAENTDMDKYLAEAAALRDIRALKEKN